MTALEALVTDEARTCHMQVATDTRDALVAVVTVDRESDQYASHWHCGRGLTVAVEPGCSVRAFVTGATCQ